MSPLHWSSATHGAVEVVREVRLCLDLNVWAAAILSRRAGRRNTATQLLTEAAIDGHCALGPTRLVVSWGMLTRFESVLVERMSASAAEARTHITRIARAATVDPTGGGPLLVLGGTGLVALNDEEDAHVLEAAVVGRADLVVTANFADFVNYRTRVLDPGRIAIHRTAGHEVLIAHPAVAAAWVRTGEIRIG